MTKPNAISGIYAIVEIATGRTYIGQSRDIEKRWYSHRTDLKAGRHGCKPLQVSWTLHGASAFRLDILERCRPDRLRQRESHWIFTYAPKLYNLGASYAAVKLVKPTRRPQRQPLPKIAQAEWERIFMESAHAAIHVGRNAFRD